jgi:prepilin-type N-terminal cleavage/methylation domain-containing protein
VRRGFTLLELLVTLTVIAILVTLALPNLLGSMVVANETAALATVRQIVQSQLAFVNRKEADGNRNGQGEYGTFGELSGAVAVRSNDGGTKFLEPATINPSFNAVSSDGLLVRHGYYFRIYLPDASGDGVPEVPGGGAPANLDPDLAETTWAVYAWPLRKGVSGNKTYFANQNGEISYTESDAYDGAEAVPSPGAALLAPGTIGSLLGSQAIGREGRDGNFWKIVRR